MRHLRSLFLAVLAVLLAMTAVPATAGGDTEDTATVAAGDGHDLDAEHDAGADRDHAAREAEIAREGEKARELDASGVTSPFFNESGGCGPSSGVATPLTTTDSSWNRSIPAGHEVRGPYGDFFGRSYGDVDGSQVWWTVPMSGGARVRVHERALPAFLQVTENLNAEAAKGNHYQARLLGSYVWRRIGGSYRMSNHAFGTAIDINWDRNPYSGSDENVLITDMPAWYVEAWTDAGFCWGGDWVWLKDPMHFSWMGPAATPGYGTVPAPFPPTTVRSGYDSLAFTGSSVFGALDTDFTYGFADGNRDSAPDLFRVRSWGADDVLLEFARSSRDFQSCGVTALRARGMQSSGGRYLLADFDGDARTDLWSIDESAARVTIKVAPHDTGYRESMRLDTGVTVAPDTEYAAADYDRDGVPDLYVIRRSRGEKIRVEVWSGASSFLTQIVDVRTRLNGDKPQRLKIGVGDRNVDGIPDLYAVRVFSNLSLVILDGATGYRRGPERLEPAVSADRQGAYGLGDYDGDGRTDLMVVDRNGEVEVALGGVQPRSADFWFRPADWECTDTVTAADPWDYNGDRASDMTIGVPGEDLSGGADTGLVHIVDGSAAGPAASALWYQDLLTISPSEFGDAFGAAVGWGDFDDDGYADIVVGAPLEDLGAVADAGLVNVVYGSGDGVDPEDEDVADQIWHRDLSQITGGAVAGDRWGATIAAGDFDGDGYDDLVVASPGRASGAGELVVIYGSNQGLSAAGNQVLDASFAAGSAAPGDGFGEAMAAGDFNRDGFSDLAVGAPGEDHAGAPDSGAVAIFYGSVAGLTAANTERLTQAAGSAGGNRAAGDRFGASLVAADFDGNGGDDLAIGSPGETVGSQSGAGAVHVVFGTSGGLVTEGVQMWHLDAAGLNGAATADDAFGAELAAGDFDDDGFAELAIGVPNSTVGIRSRAGVVMVLHGSRAGLEADGSQRWHAGKTTGDPQVGAGFGTSLAVGDFNGDLVDDLLVGSPDRDVTGIVDAGRVSLIYGRLYQGLGRVGALQWNQGAAVGGAAEPGDGFGIVAR